MPHNGSPWFSNHFTASVSGVVPSVRSSLRMVHRDEFAAAFHEFVQHGCRADLAPHLGYSWGHTGAVEIDGDDVGEVSHGFGKFVILYSAFVTLRQRRGGSILVIVPRHGGPRHVEVLGMQRHRQATLGGGFLGIGFAGLLAPGSSSWGLPLASLPRRRRRVLRGGGIIKNAGCSKVPAKLIAGGSIQQSGPE